jgi:hypothetical protein
VTGTLQDVYVNLLMDRVREERFPHPEHLDRIEASLRTPEELREYLGLLLSIVGRTKRPSPTMLDRLQRLAALERKVRQ